MIVASHKYFFKNIENHSSFFCYISYKYLVVDKNNII